MRFIKKHKFITILLILLSIYLYDNFTRIVETNPLVDKNSVHYINDLYASDGRRYKCLDKDEKKIYMKIVNNTKEYESSFTLYNNDYNSENVDELTGKVTKVYRAVLLDHPELMNYAGISWRWEGYTPDHINVKLSFAFQNKFKEYIGQLRIQKIISDIKEDTKNMSEAEKVKYVYE